MRMPNAEVMKRRNLNIKLRVFKAYSGGDIKCYCCGETIIEMLTLDHIEGGGNAHRVSLGGRKDWGGHNLYRWLAGQKFPPGYRVACFNCNYGRSLNNGICPHKSPIKRGTLFDLTAAPSSH
jgi:hypothetical protein